MKFYDVECRLRGADVWYGKMTFSKDENVRYATKTLLEKNGEVIAITYLIPIGDLKVPNDKFQRKIDAKVKADCLDVGFIMMLDDNHSVLDALKEFGEISNYEFELVSYKETNLELFANDIENCSRNFIDDSDSTTILKRFLVQCL